MHAIDVRNLCTSLVLLVINKVNVRSLEKEEKNPVNWRQPWKHLTHILPFLSPSLFTNSPLYPTPLPLSTEEVCHIRKHQFSREIIFFHPPPPAINAQEHPRSSQWQSREGHQLLTPPVASWQSWRPYSISPFLPLKPVMLYSTGHCWWSIKHYRTPN